MRRCKRRFRPPLPRRPGKRKALTTAATPAGAIVRRLEAFVQSPSLGKPKLFYDGPVPGWEKEGSR